MTLFAESECPRCGCTGLHACIGHKPKPMTPKEEKEFNKKLDEIFRRVAEEEGRLPEVSIEKSREISERGRKALLDRYGD